MSLLCFNLGFFRIKLKVDCYQELFLVLLLPTKSTLNIVSLNNEN